MALFDKYNSVTNPVSVSYNEGVAIYTLFKQGYDETRIFTKFHYDIAQAVIIKNEFKMLEDEILEMVSGQHVTFIDEIVEDENGSHLETTHTTYIPSTKSDLISNLSSEILNIETVVNDTIAYNPDYNPGRTWEDFRIYYFGE